MTEHREANGPVTMRGLVRKLALAAVLGALTIAALSAHGDVAAVSRDLRELDYSYFVVALALSMGNYLARAGRWQYYLRHVGIKVPLGESVLVFLSGMVMTITPGKMGEVFKSFLLKWTRDKPLAETSAIVVAERVTDLIALVLLAAWGSLLYPGGAIIAGVLLAAAFAVVLITTWKALGLQILRLLGRVSFLKPKMDRVSAAYEALVNMLKPVPLAVGVTVALGAWLLQVMGLAWLVRGLASVDIDLQRASFIYCSPMLAGVLALLPGGIGVTEAGMARLLESSGEWATPAVAVSVTILVRIATLWWAVLVGAIALVIHRHRTGWVLQTDRN